VQVRKAWPTTVARVDRRIYLLKRTQSSCSDWHSSCFAPICT
jgi:hypothetical protein